jgi:phage shock protein B
MSGISFFLVVVGLPVVCVTVIILAFLLVSMLKGRPAERASKEETQLMQEMHQSLLRMEKRIDALETIYFEMDRNSKGTKS